MSGSEVRSASSTTMPLSTSSPRRRPARRSAATPTAMMTVSRGQLRAGGGDRAGHRAAGSGHLAEPLTEPERHAVAAVQVREHLAELGAQRAPQRPGLRLHDRDLAAVLARGGRGLQADPAGPGDDDLAAAAQRGGQPLRVPHRAQVPDAVEIGPGDVQPPRRGAGGDQQPVVGHGLAALQGDPVARPVDRRHGRAAPQVDVVLGVPAVGEREYRFPAVLAQQVPLGQRRPLVRVLVFRADEHDRALEALLPEGFRGLGAGQARSDDHKGGFGRHLGLLPVTGRSTVAGRAQHGLRAGTRPGGGPLAAGTVRFSLPPPAVPGDGRSIRERGDLVDDDAQPFLIRYCRGVGGPKHRIQRAGRAGQHRGRELGDQLPLPGLGSPRPRPGSSRTAR